MRAKKCIIESPERKATSNVIDSSEPKSGAYHSHHILPKNCPYLSHLHDLRDHPMWQVSLTVEGHACQHDILYRVFGWWGDKLAADGLSGLIGHDEAHRRGAAQGGSTGSASRKRTGKYAREFMRAQPVVAINKKTGEERAFRSIIDCAEQLGLHASHVSECSREVPMRKSTGGWIIRRQT